MNGDKHQVWVWAEHYRGQLAPVSLGLLGKAQELCQQLGGGQVASVLAGADSLELAEELIEYGCDKVYLADDAHFSYFETEICAHFMTELIRRQQPDLRPAA